MKFKYLINDIVINFLFFRNFANIEDIKIKCNQTENLSKFTSNKKILSEIIACCLWWAFLAIASWVVSCGVMAQWFWVGELGLA